MDDATAVALAKPIWMTIRNKARIAKTRNTVIPASPRPTEISLASQAAAFVDSSAEPMLIPIPKSSSVPQEIRLCASFQVMMPIPGSIMSVTAMIVVVVVSIGCRIFSVTQNSSRPQEIASSFFSAAVIGPISLTALRTAASPPSTSIISGGKTFMHTK